MTPPGDHPATGVPTDAPARPRSTRRRWLALGLLLALLALAVVACAPLSNAGSAPTALAASAAASAGASPAATASHAATPTAAPAPLKPATPGADPVGLIAWLFTPIFQTLFVILAWAYAVTGNVGIAIIALTIVIRLVTIPLFRQQIVSQRRMQLLQPELKRLQQQYKGDRQRMSQAQMELYKDRGINPAAGCLPSILQMGLLFPMYWVIRDGLTNWDPSAMLRVSLPIVGNLQLVPITCPNPAHIIDGVVNKAAPCINTSLLGIDVGLPWTQLELFGFGISTLAILSAILQFFQGRMVMPPSTGDADASSSVQRNTLLLLPLMTVLWGGFLPAGLYIYWIVTTVVSLIQQYLIVGWGQMFPMFGWNPGFAQNHTPRFPVQMPSFNGEGTSVAASRRRPEDRAVSAAATVRPRQPRGRQGRRGRRR